MVVVLRKFFSMNETQAEQVMLTAHKQGQAACGVFPREIAEMKLDQIDTFVADSRYPLQFTVEPA